MLNKIRQKLKEQNSLFHFNEGVTICTVANQSSGIVLAKALLYELVDRKTVLYLSGGTTPKELYMQFAKDEKIMPGAVGQIDERYGEPFHANSNQKMIRETAFLRYLEIVGVPFYPILKPDVKREEAARAYDQKVRSLHAIFQTSIGVLGIGADGHTSSIAPQRKDFANPMFAASQKELLVSELNDQKSFYGERVGMTFLGLSMLDVLIVLVFGENKEEALNLLFMEGLEEEIPARFFKRPDIAKKTLFITDQRV